MKVSWYIVNCCYLYLIKIKNLAYENFVLCLYFYFFHLSVVSAQDVVPFQLKDQHAKKITAKILDELQKDDWYCYDRRMRYDGTFSRVHLGYQMVFQKDGTLILSRHGQTEKLQWSIEDDELLWIRSEIADPYPTDKILGAYAIYKIDNEELILAKSLTSNFDYKQILYFYHAERYFALAEVKKREERANEKRAKALKQQSEIETYKAKFTWNGDSTLSDEENLKMKIKATCFMAQRSIPQELNDWNKEQLEKYLEELRSGK